MYRDCAWSKLSPRGKNAAAETHLHVVFKGGRTGMSIGVRFGRPVFELVKRSAFLLSVQTRPQFLHTSTLQRNEMSDKRHRCAQQLKEFADGKKVSFYHRAVA